MNLPPLLGKRYRNSVDRFWPNVEIGKLFACWPWKASTSEGYGQIWISSSQVKRAHVVAFELFYGEIPKGMHVHHKCENKLCCNPFHLKLLTVKDHQRIHNPPQICSHGTIGKSKCKTCDRDRKRRERAKVAPFC